MRSCAGPVRNSSADYDKCVTRSYRPKKTSLQNRRAAVLAHYVSYSAGGGRPHAVPKTGGWPAQEAGWQRSLYDQTYEGGWLEDVRAAVLGAAKGRCLLCSVSQPYTLDHFLPQESWPSLSVLTANLIAACADCNRNKGTLANANPAQQFVHPYLDTIPLADIFLRCSPVINGVMSPGFFVEPCEGLDGDLLARLRWQFATLGLDQRYREEAIIFFGERKDDWREAAEECWTNLSQQITRERSAAVRATGCNMWKPAFLQGLLDCPLFAAEPLTFVG